MKNLVLIPVQADNEEQLQLPLGMFGDKTAIETAVESARNTIVDNVVVTTNSNALGKFCYSKGIPVMPSSKSNPNGTSRCAETASKLKPGVVANVICWPISYPYIPPGTIEEMLARYRGVGVTTCIFNIQKSLRENFLNDPSMVKVRAFHNTCADFTRSPLPGSLLHVGVYLFSLEELLKIGKIEPTNLSKTEKLEQLSWLQFGVRISNVSWRDKNYTDMPTRVVLKTEAKQLCDL